jgi:hypothetical protein
VLKARLDGIGPVSKRPVPDRVCDLELPGPELEHSEFVGTSAAANSSLVVPVLQIFHPGHFVRKVQNLPGRGRRSAGVNIDEDDKCGLLIERMTRDIRA